MMLSAATRASCSAITIGRSSAAAAIEVIDGLRPADPAAQEERRAGVHRDQVDVLDDPEHLAGAGHDREVPKAAIEHVEQHLAPEPVRRTRVRGRRHRRGDGLAPAEPGGEDATAQVAVGEDPERPVAGRG